MKQEVRRKEEHEKDLRGKRGGNYKGEGGYVD